MKQGHTTRWALGALVTVPAACCVGAMIMGRGAARREVTVTPGVEAPGTFALEGRLAGVRGRPPLRVSLAWTDDRDGAQGAATLRAPSADGAFRVVIPAAAAGSRVLRVSVFTEDRMGGTVHTSLGGNAPVISARGRDRVSGVPIDLQRGMDFAGTVRDARTGAALGGVQVFATVKTYGRDGWAPPQVFAVSEPDGRWALYGVDTGRLPDRARPELRFVRPGYDERVASVPAPASGEQRAVDVVLAPRP